MTVKVRATCPEGVSALWHGRNAPRTYAWSISAGRCNERWDVLCNLFASEAMRTHPAWPRGNAAESNAILSYRISPRKIPKLPGAGMVIVV
jgi:hypothetical protein